MNEITAREKFLETVMFNTGVSPPLYELGYWTETIMNWYEQGLPQEEGLTETVRHTHCVWSILERGPGGMWSCAEQKPRCGDLEKVIRFDSPVKRIPFEGWIYPRFERTVVEEDDSVRVIIDESGIKQRVKKEGVSMPQYLDWPVKDRDSWEQFKEERLNPRIPGRYPENQDRVWGNMKKRDYPLILAYTPIGFYGSLARLLGPLKLMTNYYDDPGLIKDIIEYLTDFWIQMWEPILRTVTPDCTFMWEDMCFKTGPLVSPDIFREFMLPSYKKITSFLKENGVDTIILDTDGNAWKLIPLFLEGGITGLFPMEVAAGMDVVKLRKSFPSLQIMGGIDKREIAKGKQAIDRELDERIPFMMKKGGYIPFVDHLVPSDISFRDFIYYRSKLEELTQG